MTEWSAKNLVDIKKGGRELNWERYKGKTNNMHLY